MEYPITNKIIRLVESLAQSDDATNSPVFKWGGDAVNDESLIKTDILNENYNMNESENSFSKNERSNIETDDEEIENDYCPNDNMDVDDSTQFDDEGLIKQSKVEKEKNESVHL